MGVTGILKPPRQDVKFLYGEPGSVKWAVMTPLWHRAASGLARKPGLPVAE
jgi:hypothetical protein